MSNQPSLVPWVCPYQAAGISWCVIPSVGVLQVYHVWLKNGFPKVCGNVSVNKPLKPLAGCGQTELPEQKIWHLELEGRGAKQLLFAQNARGPLRRR